MFQNVCEPAIAPYNWIKDVSPVELEKRTKEMWALVIYEFAKQEGIFPSNDLDQMITQLAKIHKVSKEKEIKTLKSTCLQNAKIDIFIEKYGHLFKKDKNGDLSYSIPMLRKITGLALE